VQLLNKLYRAAACAQEYFKSLVLIEKVSGLHRRKQLPILVLPQIFRTLELAKREFPR